MWTVEDQGSLLNIVLPKADYAAKEIVWEALLADRTYQADPYTFNEMRKKLDLEKFQVEVLEAMYICGVEVYPGFFLTRTLHCFRILDSILVTRNWRRITISFRKVLK